MKRIILILLTSLFFPRFALKASLRAERSLLTFAQSMSEVFTSMPDSIFPLLTEKNRRDMVDFYNNRMEAKVRNRLNDYVQLDTLTDDFMRLTLSAASAAEMKLLQTEDSVEIICLIQSVTSPVKDSRVKFYSKDWQRLYWLEMPTPETTAFFAESPDSVTRDLRFAQRSIDDLRFVSISIDPAEPIFTFILSVEELEREQKTIARRYLRSLRYRWTGSRFEIVTKD